MRSKAKKISVLGVCSGLGQKKPGLELAPQALRDFGLISDLQSFGHQVFDLGDLHPNKNLDPWEMIERVRSRNAQALSESDQVILIGGDHSLAVGSVQASLDRYPSARVLWVDAHGDINTPASSISGNLHGMPLAALLGLFENPNGGPVLQPENLLVVGVRDLDPTEKYFLDELQINVVFAEEILAEPRKSKEKIRRWLQSSNPRPLHLSFDIDSMDPSTAPATGLRVPNGLSFEFVRDLMRLVRETESLVALDFVELNPLEARFANELNETLSCARMILFETLELDNLEVTL